MMACVCGGGAGGVTIDPRPLPLLRSTAVRLDSLGNAVPLDGEVPPASSACSCCAGAPLPPDQLQAARDRRFALLVILGGVVVAFVAEVA